MESVAVLEQLSNPSIWTLVGIAIGASLVPGLPEEIPILLVGVGASLGLVSFPKAFFTIFAALLVVDNAFYWLAYSNKRIIAWVQRKVFKDAVDVQSLTVRRHLRKFVFYSRFIIQARVFVPLLAGANRMPWGQYVVRGVPALALYILILMGIGSYFDQPVLRMLENGTLARGLSIVGIIVIAMIVALFIFGPKIFTWMAQRLQREEKKVFTKIETD